MRKTIELRDKNILLLSPSFFSYEKLIKEKMEEMGANVFLFNERAVNSSFSRALLYIAPWLFAHKTKKYYDNIISSVSSVDLDYILIIKCDMISTRTLKRIKASFPKAKLCLYLWDSKNNIKGINKKIKCFDFASSFDRFDCIADDRIKFRPLFFAKTNTDQECEKKSDLCFCGTIHTDRYYVLKKLASEAADNGLTINIFAYLQANFMFAFYKIFGKGFKSARKKEFSFEKKTIQEILKMENESEVVIDIQDPKQTGLTMRTIEMIGAKKRFITTNEDIINYDFFDKNNIMIIDRKDPHLDVDFLKNKYKELPEKIYEKYSIHNWILDVLGEGI